MFLLNALFAMIKISFASLAMISPFMLTLMELRLPKTKAANV